MGLLEQARGLGAGIRALLADLDSVAADAERLRLVGRLQVQRLDELGDAVQAAAERARSLSREPPLPTPVPGI